MALTISAKYSIIAVWLDSEYASVASNLKISF